MTVSVVVPVYGPRHFLDACVVALSSTQAEQAFELVLVNNGSTALGLVPDADAVLENGRNLGFAKACNQGADNASGDVLVFLNVDTEVRDSWLAPLVAALSIPGIGIAGSRLVYPDGRIQHSGIAMSGLAAENRHDEHPSGRVDAVTGACLAIRRDTFFDLGCFDEGYFCGNEDIDLCLTAREHGIGCWYCAGSVVMHHESATGPERWSALAANIERLHRKWASEGVR